MLQTEELEVLYRTLFDRLSNQKFVGYDPYDLANSTLKTKWLINPATSFVNKLFPYNFRSQLGIKQFSNTKGNALILLASALRSDLSNSDDCVHFKDWLIQQNCQQFEEFSLGFSSKIVLRSYASTNNEASLIISLFGVFALMEYEKRFNDKSVLAYVDSFQHLLSNSWLKFEENDTLWFSYLPHKSTEVYNATAKVGRFYANYYKRNPQPEYLEIIIKILNYLQRKQRADGSWPYSSTYSYSDHFHTAFVLEAIFEMLPLSNNPYHLTMFQRGLAGYKSDLFIGARPIHFHPKYGSGNVARKLLGTEIRDCANAIIFFAKTNDLVFANQILSWTLEALYSQKHRYFYFYKNSLYTNKIDYLRWQAWMLYAISTYLHYAKN